MESAREFIDSSWITFSKKTTNILCFKREFLANSVVSAQLFICGLGFYQAKINGVIFDAHYFKPNVSDYKKRSDPHLIKKENYFAYYDTYDVTSWIREGSNVLDVYVGPGYFHNVEKFDAPVYDYGSTRLIYALVLKNADGSTTTIHSDEQTKAAVSSSSSRLFLGDHFDFSKTKLSYLRPKILKSSINLLPSKFGNDIVAEKLQPRVIKQTSDYLFLDFGKNHTGGIKAVVKGKKGAKLIVKYSEFLNKDGTPNYNSSAYADFKEEEFTPPFDECDAPRYTIIQKNEYILSGNNDVIEPLFSWRCYRYVEIECIDDFQIETIESLFIHSDIRRLSSFHCSNEIFNHIYDCYILTQLDNFHAGLTFDCPHREKIAYTGDGRVTTSAILYNFDAKVFFDKWLDDILAAQGLNGEVPNNAPDMAAGGGNFWGYAIISIPLNLYKMSGDVTYLSRCYEAMHHWIAYLSKLRDQDGIIRHNGRRWFLGDWLAPYVMEADPSFVNTVCFSMAIDDFLMISDILGKAENPQLIHLSKVTKEAINKQFFHPETASYSQNIQGETALALYANIVDQKKEEEVHRTFLKAYEENHEHIDTGFIITPMVFDLFEKFDDTDLAYRILNQTDYPSYAFMLRGETTIPEHWSKKWPKYKMNADAEDTVESTGDVSHCHPMFGSIVPWIQRNVGGIDLSNWAKHEIVYSPKYMDKVQACECSFAGVKLNYEANRNVLIHAEIPEGVSLNMTLRAWQGSTFQVTNNATKEISVQKKPIVLSCGDYLIQSLD